MTCTYCIAQDGQAEDGQAEDGQAEDGQAENGQAENNNVKCKVCRETYCDDHTYSCCVKDSHTYCPICFGRRDLIVMCNMCNRPYCRGVCGTNNECQTCIQWSST